VDQRGLAGMVTSDVASSWRDNNFGRRLLSRAVTPKALESEIDRYDASDAAKVSESIRLEASLERYLDRLEAIHREVIADCASDPTDIVALLRALSGSLHGFVAALTETRQIELQAIEQRQSAAYQVELQAIEQRQSVAYQVELQAIEQRRAVDYRIALQAMDRSRTAEYHAALQAAAHDRAQEYQAVLGALQSRNRELEREIGWLAAQKGAMRLLLKLLHRSGRLLPGSFKRKIFERTSRAGTEP
jgi:hypothetical protein